MVNGGFLINNLTPGCDNISANNTADGYDVGTLKNEFVSDVFRSENNSVNIDIEMVEPVPFSSIAIINHNIPSGSTINLKLSSTGFVTFNEIISMSSGWYSRYIYKKDSNGNLLKTFAPNLYKTFSEKTFKYIRIEIVSTLYIQIGEVFIGEIFQFPKNFDWPYILVFNTAKTLEDINGQYIENQNSEQEGFKLNFSSITISDRESFKHLFRAGMKVFIPDMEEPECFHGVVLSNTFETSRELYSDNFSIDFMENAL